LSEWTAQGDWRLYFINRDRIEKVTPEAVQAAAHAISSAKTAPSDCSFPLKKRNKLTFPLHPI